MCALEGDTGKFSRAGAAPIDPCDWQLEPLRYRSDLICCILRGEHWRQYRESWAGGRIVYNAAPPRSNITELLYKNMKKKTGQVKGCEFSIINWASSPTGLVNDASVCSCCWFSALDASPEWSECFLWWKRFIWVEDATRTEEPWGSGEIWNRNPSLPFSPPLSLFLCLSLPPPSFPPTTLTRSLAVTLGSAAM